MAGEYRLGRLLGEGGFGAVYEAEHPLLKRRAAVKVLHRVAERDSDAVQRFISEAQAVNQIRSRHIIDIFSFGTLSDGRHFYVMDFLEGEPLDRFLARSERVDVKTTLQLLAPIADALDLVHRAGIIHRDLKPQNIFLAWDDADEVVPKLLDFGMAKLLSNSPVRTVSGTPIGTPLYMAPEQARGDKVDGRCDVYALGVLCYEMLTGRLPFDAETTVAILMAHLIQNPEKPSEVLSELPFELDAPLLRMLEKDPAARPATAGEALTGLLDAAARAGISVPKGAPKLTRPEPTVSGEFEREVESTLLADPPTQEHPEKRRESSRPRTWQLALLAALIVSAFTVWLNARGRSQPVRSTASAFVRAAPSTVASQSPVAPKMPPVAQPAQPASQVSSAVVAPKRAKPSREQAKKAASAGATPATPRDLESPFGP
jgi:serine/threonine-protein kinase